MNTILQIFRIIINDLDGDDYVDTDLQKIIAVAATFVQMELTFESTYTINVISPSISPDPDDAAFMNFVAMKAAIFLIRGELKDLSLNSVRIVDGPSTVDLTSQFKNKAELLETLEDQYAQDKIAFGMNHNIGGYRAVVSTPSTVDYL